jgi:tetratricopeptide (TPR) repeat protein
MEGMMFRCPACGIEVKPEWMVCNCGASLGLLRQLESVADAWYNRGLSELSAGRIGEALNWFSASCAARPTDAEARLAQAKVWGQLGHWPECARAVQRAREIDPTLPGLEELECLIAEQKTLRSEMER